MTIFIVSLFAVALILTGYALWGRAWLRSKPWAARFFAWIEPIELALYKKSETILLGRLIWVGGLLVTAYDAIAAFLGNLDLTPVTTRILDFLHVPSDLRGVVLSAFVTAIGFAVTWLRSRTTKPLELVAVQESTAPAEVKVAIAQADEAKEQAVATVKAAA